MIRRAWLLFACLWISCSPALACQFLKEQCNLITKNGGSGVMRCFLRGDANPNEPKLDKILAQDFRSGNELYCPSLYNKGDVRFEFWLFPCKHEATVATINRFTVKQIATNIDAWETPGKSQGHYAMPFESHEAYNESLCETRDLDAQNTFTITTPLLNTEEARGFKNGVSVRMLPPTNQNFGM